jgi:hypothetical protein
MIKVGVQFARDYVDIVDDLSQALLLVNKNYEFIGMSAGDWERLTSRQKQNCLQTMADDVIYALGRQPRLRFGESTVSYEHQVQAIMVNGTDDVTHVIHLK